MNQENLNPQPSAASLPRPRYFLGEQPVAVVADYQSEEDRNWSTMYHVVTDIFEPMSVHELLDIDPSEMNFNCNHLFDHDCYQLNDWLREELVGGGGLDIKWSGMCGIRYDESDPPDILRSGDTKLDDNGFPKDEYWKLEVYSRDDAMFWHYLLSDSSSTFDIDWPMESEPFSKMVMDWVRENPAEAKEWLNASPTPIELIGESDGLTKLIKKITRAIKQGQLSED